MKSKLLLVIICITSHLFCNAQSKVLKYHIAETFSRLEGYKTWKSDEKMNQNMEMNINLNIEDSELIFTTKYQKQPTVTHTYVILSYNVMSDYRDFGFRVLDLKIKEDKGNVLRWQIGYTEVNGKIYAVLLEADSKVIQFKHILQDQE